jgi:hypothetical protein
MSASDKVCECGCGASVARRFVHNHHARKSAVEYILKDRGYTSPCWIWQRGQSHKKYGTLKRNGKVQPAHRYFYERHFGPLPPNKELHHLCEQKLCVNPDHLEPVTDTEHARKHLKTHCKHGHAFTPENTLFDRTNNNRRVCKACRHRIDAARR